MKRRFKKNNNKSKNITCVSPEENYDINDTFNYNSIVVNGMTEAELKSEMNIPVNNEKQLNRILLLNNWNLVSTNKHMKFQRSVLYKGENTRRKQTYIRSISPSGTKEYVYILRNIRNQNDNLKYIF